MQEKTIQDRKKDMIAIGRLLWEKNLTVGLSGNISGRVDEDSFLITATQTCLGLLSEPDVLHVDTTGAARSEEGIPSTEWRLHAAVYQAFSDCHAMIHVHALHTNAFFLKNDRLDPKILEAKFVLGDVPVVDQHTLNVEDCGPVLKAFKKNSLVVLRNHGCLAMGKDLFECFVKLQTLEEAVQTEIILKWYS